MKKHSVILIISTTLALFGWFFFDFAQANATEMPNLKNVISQSRKIILETPDSPNLIIEPAEGFLNKIRTWVVLGIRQSHLDEYNELYLSAHAYKNYALQELGIAEKFLVGGNADVAREHIERSASYLRLWHLYDSAALEVWSRNIEKAQEIEYEVGKLSASIPGLAGKTAGGKLGGAVMGGESMLLNYWLDSQFKSVSVADRNAAKDIIVGKVAEAISEEAGLKVSATKLAFGLVELNKLVKTGVSAPEEIAKLIADELESRESTKKNDQTATKPNNETASIAERPTPQDNKKQEMQSQESSNGNNSAITQEIFSPGEAATLRPTLGCDKQPVDVPPPNFKYPRVSAVNIKWTKVNPFIELEWGAGINKNSEMKYKIYRDGALMLPGVWFDQPSFGDGSVVTGTTYTYLVKTEYPDGSIQDSKPLKITVPKDICGIVPYVDLKVNGGDELAVSSPLSTKFDIELTTFVGSENEGYGQCYQFGGGLKGGIWGMFMEPQDIYTNFDYEAIYTFDNAPFLDGQSLSIMCPTKEEEKQFLNTVSGFSIALPDILSSNLNPVNLMRLLASGLWLESRPQTGNFFGCWGCDLTLTHLLPYGYVLEAVQKFRPRADAVQVVFSQYKSNAPGEIATKNFRPCQQSVTRGNFLDLEAAMAGEPERLNSAVVILSTDNNLDLKDIILGEALHPVQLLQKCGNFDSIDHSFYIPDTISAGNYFIGLLFRDGQQITAPLRVE